ncbi:MAG: hypothetical protein HUU47_09935 [Bacteroidetes bacterium]|nr:hypothetical protein [Bacteroidota bacterium]
MKCRLIVIAITLIGINTSNAQNTNNDSANVAKTLKELLKICRTVDFTDPQTTSLGTFYKAAPYIIYRGDDKNRAWKDFANYNNEDEKTGVDNVCLKINGTINQDTNYVITKYETGTESEGKWHILKVEYFKKGIKKQMAFAFLFVKGRYGLGDID